MGKRSALLFIIAIIIIIAVATIYIIVWGNKKTDIEPPKGCGLLRVYIINVSQADAIVIITPMNKTVMIDAGSEMKPQSAERVVAFLRERNVSRIDYVIATHYHEDHIGGIERVFKETLVGAIYHNGNCGNYSSMAQKRFEEYTSSHQSVEVRNDMDLDVDSCLSQSKLIVPYDRHGCWASNKESSNENENSILLRIVYGNTSFLFTGDCERGCERQLLQEGKELHADFLKVGHHGSSTSSSLAFLNVVGARFYAISTDKNRSVSDGYYHPRQASLSNIYYAGANGPESLFRTDIEGDISVVSDGKDIVVRTEVPADSCQLFSGYSESNISSYGPISALVATCK